MSKLERLVSFIQVVESNGFAAAGRQLKVSTAAISRQVTLLEMELGVQLLARTTRQLSLTEIGLRYYEECKNALRILSEADDAIAGSQKEARGILRVTCNRFFAFNHIIPKLAEFQNSNPKLKIDIEVAERFPDFSQEKIDILYGVSREGSPDLVRRRITDTEYLLCASPKYIEKHGLPTHPNDLIHHVYITHQMRKPIDILKFSDGHEIYIPPTLVINDTAAMREAALVGLGIINLHDYEVKAEIDNGNLIQVLKHFPQPSRPVYLYYKPNKYLHPKIRKFIDFYLSE